MAIGCTVNRQTVKYMVTRQHHNYQVYPYTSSFDVVVGLDYFVGRHFSLHIFRAKGHIEKMKWVASGDMKSKLVRMRFSSGVLGQEGSHRVDTMDGKRSAHGVIVFVWSTERGAESCATGGA